MRQLPYPSILAAELKGLNVIQLPAVVVLVKEQADYKLADTLFFWSY